MADQMSQFVLPMFGRESESSKRVAKVPHLSGLAEKGAVFDNCYCNSPLCAPARASLVTGMRVRDHKAYGNGAEFRATVPTMMHHLKRNGYHTVVSGKTHFVGPDQLHGFDDRLTTDIYPSDFLWIPNWEEGVKHGPGTSVEKLKISGLCRTNNQIQYDTEVKNRAVEFLQSYALGDNNAYEERPFFLMASFTQPHESFQTIPKYWDLYNDVDIPLPDQSIIENTIDHPHSRWVQTHHGVDRYQPTDDVIRTSIRAYLAMISHVDDLIGEILAELEVLGLSDNTMIIFTSDHGEMLGEHNMWYKRTFYDENAKVPLLVSWPGTIPAGRTSEVVSHIDLQPTVLDLLGDGTNRNNDRKAFGVQGDSFKHLLTGTSGKWKNEAVIDYCGGGTAAPMFIIRKDEWKYVYVYGFEPLLFNLAEDPHELRNRADDQDQRERVTELHRRLLDGLDVEAFTEEIKQDQKKRLFLQQIRNADTKKKHTWDFQPYVDASKQYVRGANKPVYC